MYAQEEQLSCSGGPQHSYAVGRFQTDETMATNEERALARRLFMCRVTLANATAFQSLFWDVMKAKCGQDFATVAPQGQKGDGGNDGYHTIEKHYYQLFAPVSPKDKIATAIGKLTTDFAKVLAQWGGKKGSGLLRFSFAFNDKYEGAPKEIEKELDELRKKHKKIKFAQYCCRDLETDFMALPETEWDRILGGTVPDPARVGNLDYSVLREVIRHVMSADIAESESRLDLPPELDQKIALNKLSSIHGVRIQNGALLTGRIDKYFTAHSAFALDELRDHVVGAYEAAKAIIRANPPTDGTSEVDAVFVLFRRSLFPKNATAATVTAVDAVIGYFFEACDVFDPKATKGLPGASP
jgi:hypothetical protein